MNTLTTAMNDKRLPHNWPKGVGMKRPKYPPIPLWEDGELIHRYLKMGGWIFFPTAQEKALLGIEE